jgi:cell wall-associated NlpC family hydrolase
MTASVGAVATQATAADAATATSARDSAGLSRAQTLAKPSKVAKQRVKAHTAVSAAKRQIGDPYRWGASGPGSFDCSGLVMYAWRKAGVRLPRIAASQFRTVRKKVSWKNLKPGDLMFFRGLGHVGMYVGHGKMIHSPHSGARVRVDKLSGYRRTGFVGAVRPGV